MLKSAAALTLQGFHELKAFEHKKYPFCGSKQVKRNGCRNGKQRYKCHACGRQFDGGRRLNPQEIWQAYSEGKQTAAQLAKTYGCSRQTILRHLKKVQIKVHFISPAAANVIMDTTYFGHSFGIMVLLDRTRTRRSSRWR